MCGSSEVKPRRRAKRRFKAGDIIRVRRPRDGKAKCLAYVEAFNEDKEFVRVLLPSGDTQEVITSWCVAHESALSLGSLPKDVLSNIAGFLSAKRTGRAAQTCANWRNIFGVAEDDDHWQTRLLRRWPPPVPVSVPTETNWLASFRAKLCAERKARAKARKSPRSFVARVCTWPLCCNLLDDRSKALRHNADHFGCWGTMTHEDVEWLNQEVGRLQKQARRVGLTVTDRKRRLRVLLQVREDLRNCKSLVRFFRADIQAKLQVSRTKERFGSAYSNPVHRAALITPV